MPAMFAWKGASPKGGKGNLAGAAIHGDSVRYVELSGGRDSLSIVRQAIVPVAYGAVVKNSLAALDSVIAALIELKLALGGFKCPVVLGIPSRDVILRLVEYPKMSLENVKEALQFEFDKYFPYQYDEAAADVSEVEVPGADNADKSTFLVAACKSRMVSDIMMGTSRLGMPLAAVEPMNVAFFRAAIGPGVRADSYFVVSVEPESTHIMLGYKDNGILFRSTAADLKSIDARESGEWVTPILRDVQNTIIFAGNQYRGLTPSHIILGGTTGVQSKLARLLTSATAIKVEPLDVWNLWGVSPATPGNRQGNTGGPVACGFETAFGLAVRDLI